MHIYLKCSFLEGRSLFYEYLNELDHFIFSFFILSTQQQKQHDQTLEKKLKLRTELLCCMNDRLIKELLSK